MERPLSLRRGGADGPAANTLKAEKQLSLMELEERKDKK
ncbi:hypothetical protein BRO54_2659 [Geobacillus proteiniphilus]|uniref:Uncharacterized protein n=1 Tax=Geobacillus proteiniphilus TaxID=860353 RepID=A0A1Q5SU48_9BACL|nr:hypothetical protein BRO54_2659 [Geobacillus proteiniphilus]